MKHVYLTPPELKIRNSFEQCDSEIGDVNRKAKENGLTYGRQVAAEYEKRYKRPENKPSKAVCKNRTLLEGLDSELSNIDSRAEWLGDPEAIRAVAIRDMKRKEKEAQNGC